MDTALLKKFKILLVGDICTDVYQYGTIDRLSPEAPVPVFIPTYAKECEGMVGNVYNNLLALNCDIKLVAGWRSKKIRLIDAKSKQHIVRIDHDIKSDPVKLDPYVNDIFDAVVVSDYNKGAVTYEVIDYILTNFKTPIFIDTKMTDLARMQGAWVKINSLEYSRIKTECSGLIVTEGDKGSYAVYHGLRSGAPKVEVVDVTGAGDTFLAALTYRFLETNDIKQAMDFANKAASVTVQHMGVYSPTLEEIINAS